jgi:hypothetical protein
MLSGYFDECPERLLSGYVNFGSAPSFDVQLDRFAKIGPGGLDVGALRGHGEFGQRATYQSSSFVMRAEKRQFVQ